jgi:L-lactate dehydrogenase complex protein LldF
MMIYNGLNPWGKAREVPEVPGETFREWYLKNKKEKHGESQ